LPQSVFIFSWGQFCDVAKEVMIHRKIFFQIWATSKIGKQKTLKHLSIFLAKILEPHIEIWRYFLNFGRILAIENLKKYLISALLISYIAIWL
jgi:hypothetical protein